MDKKGCGRMFRAYIDPHPCNDDIMAKCGDKDPFLPDRVALCDDCKKVKQDG